MNKSKKVLIVYGSRYGSTEEIANKISNLLTGKQEFIVTLLNLKRTKTSDCPSITDYDGILIGSGIRIGKWTKEAKNFLIECKRQMSKDNPIIGIFVTCGYAADPKFYPKAIRLFIEKMIQKVEIKPNIFDAFGGVFDYSKKSKKNFIDRKILDWGARDLNLDVKHDSINDFRDWKQIENFTEEFACLVVNHKRSVKLGNIGD
ncbi:MAG: flavodoxin domain-containing protein [Candidatus Kariarchaeaceae archaeon]|jgi:menaquinone-dependent protoporphyrinogen oxidase